MSVTRYIDTEELEIRNPLFLIDTEVNTTSGTDTIDIGFVGKYYDGTKLLYTGLFRDATDSHFKLFHNLQELPIVNTGVINTSGLGYTLSGLDIAALHATGPVTVDGTLTANNDLVVLGNVSVFDIETLTVEDNIVVVNSGPDIVREDGGFVVKRAAANVATDTAKQSGTASAAGTTTTVKLQAANNHGTTLDYYKSWVVKFGGDVTGTAVVLSSTATDPPTLTFDIAASAATSTATTYQLYNKQYVGTIYDGSTGALTAYGFPREDTMGVIDLLGDGNNGNLADYIDLKAANLYANKDLYVAGNVDIAGSTTVGPIDKNIVTINSGPNNVGTDAGYVSQRAPVNVVTNDVPKIAAAPVQTAYISGSKTLLITDSATGADYFKGWVIRHGTDTTEPTYITASTVAGTTHTLTLATGFSTGLTAGTDTVDLYNKRLVGSIYNEATDNYMIVGFPHEDSAIDVDSPINGNIPDFLNIAVENLQVNGTINISSSAGSLQKNTATFTAATTFDPTDVLNNDIIYLNPSADTTYTLPTVASLSLNPNKSKEVVFVNIGSAVATVAGNGADTIEELSLLNLTRLYSKTTLTASSELTSTWIIA